MSHDQGDEHAVQLSAHDQLVEQVIAALKFLTDKCSESALAGYTEIVNEALDKCLERYVNTQLDALDGEMNDPSKPGPPIN